MEACYWWCGCCSGEFNVIAWPSQSLNVVRQWSSQWRRHRLKHRPALLYRTAQPPLPPPAAAAAEAGGCGRGQSEKRTRVFVRQLPTSSRQWRRDDVVSRDRVETSTTAAAATDNRRDVLRDAVSATDVRQRRSSARLRRRPRHTAGQSVTPCRQRSRRPF